VAYLIALDEAILENGNLLKIYYWKNKLKIIMFKIYSKL